MQEEIHLRDYVKVVLKRRNSVLTFFCILVLVVTIGTLTATPVYRASTRVLIDKENQNIIDLKGIYYESFYSEDYYQTQYELIRSNAVAIKVVRNLNLDKRPDFNYALKKKGNGILGGSGGKSDGSVVAGASGAATDELVQSLARRVQAGVIVEPVKNSRIVSISYEYPNAAMAAEITNGIANAYVEQVLDIKTGTAKQAVEWMTKKIDEQKSKLEQSQKALQDYMKNKDIVALENKEAITPQKLQNLSAQLVAAETKRREVEALYNQVRGLSGNLTEALAVPAIAADPVVQSLRSEEIRREKDVLETSKKFGDKHPQMIRIREDLKALREKTVNETKRVITSIKNEYELVQAKEASLRNLFAKGKGEAMSMSEKSIEFGVLRREVESNQQVYEALLKRIKETSLVEEIKSFNIYIVDRAETPKGPIKPKKFANILLSLVVGLFGGVGIAFFLEYIDNTFKTPEDVEEKLSLPLLGVIPIVKSSDVNEGSIETLAHTSQKTSVAETYKALRTSILLSSVDPVKSFVITSSIEDEGKTTTAINLAITFAQLEQRVLLVDGDLRKPKVHSAFGIDNSIGLSSYLTRDVIQDVIKSSEIPNLSLIVAGPLPPNPSELLSSQRMKDFIDMVTDKFDVVIFDAAPLIHVTDTTILSALVNGTILVIRSGRTTFDVAKRGTKLLRDANSRILGAVLNGLDTQKEGYRYLYPYYYYDYGREKGKSS